MTAKRKDKESKGEILAAAEKLFSRLGFQGTSMDQIAAAAGVNKALIYYYFPDKNELIAAIIQKTLDELSGGHGETKHAKSQDPAADLRDELAFLAGKRDMLAILFAEALKGKAANDSLFRSAEIVFGHASHAQPDAGGESAEQQFRTLHEFFSGFVPLLAFVVLRRGYARYFGVDEAEMTEQFIRSFTISHLASHERADAPGKGGGDGR
jgi:AcrR family transcriptional regulator